MPRAPRTAAIGLAVGLAVSLLPNAASAAGGVACDTRTNNTPTKLVECVTLEGVRQHQAAFQSIADANGGVRTSGTPGYDASAAYVADSLTAAGYDVSVQEFDFAFFDELAPGELEQLSPIAATYETGTMSFSGSGSVTGAVTPVDLSLADPAASTSGCEASDFAGLDFSGSGDIALIQRGACFFSDKALNAQAAGAEAVVIFNQGIPGREDLFFGTLGAGAAGVVTIPVVSASFTDGVALSEPGSTARVFTSTTSEIRTTSNVLAQTPQGRTDNVVMAGAHLDSVPTGPGIQDNGSGSAALLEVALQMRKATPENAVRFAWWGAEESGLVGSDEYVFGLSDEERAKIALYLNFDMIGSPNHFFGVYDADESTFDAADFGVVVPPGSIAIEDVFESFYTSRGLPYDDSGFSGRSDYQAFIDFGIPAGGLFTGAEVIKTPEQAAIWGGTAGDQFDPCYHLACDTFDNINLSALDANADAVAWAVMTFAYSTEDVNGVRGRQVPGNVALPAPAGPEGTFASGGGGLEHDHADNS